MHRPDIVAGDVASQRSAAQSHCREQSSGQADRPVCRRRVHHYSKRWHPQTVFADTRLVLGVNRAGMSHPAEAQEAFTAVQAFGEILDEVER